MFTLTNIYDIEPTKIFHKNDNNHVYHNMKYGPCFGAGNDFIIYPDFNNGGESLFPNSYKDTIGKGKSIFTGDLNNDNKNFKLNEIEIFKVI